MPKYQYRLLLVQPWINRKVKKASFWYIFHWNIDKRNFNQLVDLLLINMLIARDTYMCVMSSQRIKDGQWRCWGANVYTIKTWTSLFLKYKSAKVAKHCEKEPKWNWPLPRFFYACTARCQSLAFHLNSSRSSDFHPILKTEQHLTCIVH